MLQTEAVKEVVITGFRYIQTNKKKGLGDKLFNNLNINIRVTK